MAQKTLQWSYLGQIPYRRAWLFQQKLRYQRLAGKIPDTALFLEHPPVITTGRIRGAQSLLCSPEYLKERGIELLQSDRGGDATLHAPGQLMGYLIFNLKSLGLNVPQFAEKLGRALSSFLQKNFEIASRYDPNYPGVWVKNDKIAAFGFHIYRGVSIHGFALNVTTDLELFNLIIPCGLQNKGVTSLQKLLRDANNSRPLPDLKAIASTIAKELSSEFNLKPTQVELSVE